MGSTEANLERAGSSGADSSRRTLSRVALTAVLAALGYYVGALAGGLVQPLPALGLASAWLANACLLGILLMTPYREWPAYVLAALVGHLLVHPEALGSPAVLSIEAVANLGQAVLSAWLVRRYIAPSGWFERLRQTNWFIGIAGLLIPVMMALAATGVLQWLGSNDVFWDAWRSRYRANSIAALTLTPMIVVIWQRVRAFGTLVTFETLGQRGLEYGLLIAALALVGTLLLVPSPILTEYELVLIFLPTPLFLWAATRFGLASMCAAVLAIGSWLIWMASNQAGVFSTGTLLVDGADVDLYLIVSTIPLMLIAVAVEERRHVLQQVRVSKDNFQRLAESTAAIPWEADAELWRFTYIGPQAERLLKLPLNRWLEDGFFGLRFHPDDRENTLREFARIVETGEQTELQYRMTDSADEVVWVTDIVHCERLPKGRTRLRGFMIDTTRRMKAEQQLQLLRERMSQASRIATVGELTASVSHDLYQPLTAILHNAEVAEHLLSDDRPDVAELRRIVADILEDDRRAREILQRMRSLMRSGAVARDAVDMRQLTRATVDLVSAEAGVRAVRLEFVSEPVAAVVLGDAVHLQQLVMNLVLNAFDAVCERAETDRCVTVRLEKEDESHLLVTVEDTGPGIPEAQMARLFEPPWAIRHAPFTP
ncbi:MAG: MASE1 domain-containing protein, partial [Gammaproteobacteria bacterium]